MTSLVSIIIPTYKRSKVICRAIDSVIAQDYKYYEIIVVDDNGIETECGKNTKKMLEKYSDLDNFKYIQHDININGSAARNTGFRNSKGKYIMFLDDDDEFINDKIKAQVKTLNSLGDEWGACYTSYIRKKNGVVTMRSAERREGNLLVEELMRNLFVHAGSNLMVRRNVVEELDGFNESFTRNQDIEFLTRMLVKFKLAYTNELGLVVNVGDDEKGYNFEVITDYYINKFKPVIMKQNLADQKKIYMMINLQIFRYYLINERRIFKSFKYLKQKDISIKISTKYLCYLLRRYITRTAYGFNL